MPEYYTLQIDNTSSSSTPLNLNADLIQPIISGKSSDYDVSVVRFSIPNYDSHLFTFIDNFYYMTLSWNFNNVTWPVIFIPSTIDTKDRRVWEIQNFVQMLNNTIPALYNLMSQIVTFPYASHEMPYFTYNEETELFSLTALISDYNSGVPPVFLFVNSPLFQKITGFPTFTVPNYFYTSYNPYSYKASPPNPPNTPENATASAGATKTITGFQIKVFNNYNNTTSDGLHYIMTQQANSFNLLVDWAGVVLMSNLPTKNEYAGLQNTNQSQNAQAYNVAMNVLQDYIPTDMSVKTFNNNLVYNAITPYRQVELVSDTAIYNINIQIFSRRVVPNVAGSSITPYGVLFPLRLPPNGQASIKLMFTKKNENKYA